MLPVSGIKKCWHFMLGRVPPRALAVFYTFFFVIWHRGTCECVQCGDAVTQSQMHR